MRFLATTLLLCGLGLLVSASVSAAPPPAPKFWTASRCEQVLHGRGLTTANNGYFVVGQSVCVGTGGPSACKWASGHRSRLYSTFRAFTRNGIQVRMWTFATRSGPGFVPIVHGAGDQYIGWPPDFYWSPTSSRLLATDTGPTSARFHSIVAPIAARLTQQENAGGCTGR